MRRLTVLSVLLICATAGAQPCVKTLCFGPERELVAPRWAPATSNIELIGVATNGERIALAWTKVNYGDVTWIVNYLQFEGERPIALSAAELPAADQGTAVVWSGASFFVVTRSESGGHLIPVSPTGRVGAPGELGLEMGQMTAASNGDGFLVVSDSRGRKPLHGRMFDRDGKLVHDLSLDVGLDRITVIGRDYVIATDHDRALVVHPDGSTEVQAIDALAARGAVANEGILFIGGGEIALGDKSYAGPAWDGTNYLVLTKNDLRRYSPAGSLVESMPGKYDWPRAVMPRRGAPPLLVWAVDDREHSYPLRMSDDRFMPERIVDEDAPAASSDGTSTIVAWRDANGLAASVFHAIDEPRRIIDLPGTSSWVRVSTISVHGVHYVVWQEQTAIRMLRLDANGRLLDASPVMLAETGKASRPDIWNGPALALKGREVLVVWTDESAVRGVRIAAAGRIGRSFVVAQPQRNSVPFGPVARFNGSDAVITWIEASSFRIEDHAQPLYSIYSTTLRGDVAAPATVIAGQVRYAERLAIVQSRAIWSEYVFTFYGPWPQPPGPPPPVKHLIRTVSLTAAGAAASAPATIAEMTMNPGIGPGIDVTALPLPDGSAVALWTDNVGGLEAMPLDRGYVRAGDATRIGEAVHGTLRIVAGKSGALLVYTRRVEGSSRVFIRTAK